jgi:hypothetical protein
MKLPVLKFPVLKLPVLAAVALAAPAAAQAAPPVAPSRPNLIEIAVSRVDVPEHLPGTCRVAGTVAHVVRGASYRVGQDLTLDVPCGAQPVLDARPAEPRTGPHPVDAQVLKTSRKGAALLDDAGHLIWSLPRDYVGPPLYFRNEQILGYRILDAAVLPAAPPARQAS